MLETRENERFLFEQAPGLGVFGKLGSHELDGDVPPEVAVPREHDRRHPSAAERFTELIPRDRVIGATGPRPLAAGHCLERLVVQAHIFARRSRSALPTTETELKLIAAAAIIGREQEPEDRVEHTRRDRHALPRCRRTRRRGSA